MPLFPSSIPFTEIEASLSRYITTSSMMVSRTWTANLSPPLTWATTPSYLQIAPWRGRRQIQIGPNPKHYQKPCHCLRPRNRRVTSWSVTSDKMGLTVFMTCASWTNMPSTILQRHLKSVYRRRSRQRRKCTRRLDFNNIDNSIPLLPLLKDFWGCRQRLNWKV